MRDSIVRSRADEGTAAVRVVRYDNFEWVLHVQLRPEPHVEEDRRHVFTAELGRHNDGPVGIGQPGFVAGVVLARVDDAVEITPLDFLKCNRIRGPVEIHGRTDGFEAGRVLGNLDGDGEGRICF